MSQGRTGGKWKLYMRGEWDRQEDTDRERERGEREREREKIKKREETDNRKEKKKGGEGRERLQVIGSWGKSTSAQKAPKPKTCSQQKCE